ncbi:hypothetical protein [Bacillus sp. B-jedd]|uniref:hypothetical protein n=1 Tax=Bacillus sp. B-jedd TaxID=1476857 RepID=UPI0005157028|nr:hypothetical protein [Bacillus sp. B-jedd]CEG28770.1 hypothetical protein BN1002_03693 [Bacillus sp. B-jedd]
MEGKYGLFSFVLAVGGIIFFYLSSFGENGIFNPYFYAGLASWVSSFLFGLKGIRIKERGSLKYIGIGMISLIVIGYGFLIVLIGMRGFGA